MVEFIYDIEPLADVLDCIRRNGAGRVVRDIARKLKRDTHDDLLEALHSYEDLFTHFASHLRDRGKLEDEDYDELKSVLTKVQEKLTRATQVDIKSSFLDDDARASLWALHLLGGLNVDADFSSASLLISPQMLTNAFNVASLLEASARVKHVSSIADLRGDQRTSKRH